MKPQPPLDKNPFVRHYDLDLARRHADSARRPRAHQDEALRRLRSWFDIPATTGTPRGGLLVLPTGGGKTFTAVRFLCEWPLSEGYKVLWLAHTHHLLEQAFETFGPETPSGDSPVEVARIRPPRSSLRVRVVSGMPGHAKLTSVRDDDDVLIGSLQTFSNAQRDDHASLTHFIDSAHGKLVVVFDEAHHAPAPTYARFVEALRQRIPGLRVLGLTATPVYENKLRSGWLGKLFPQGILYQTTARHLMAAKVLAEPVIEEFSTHVKAEIDERAFTRWCSTYADLPSEIIDALARNSDRNDVIVNTYVKHRKKYGRTLIFADRWFQCDYLRQALLKHGVKADVVYSHLDAKGATVDERNRRTADDNTKVIRAFKRGELDVLINVKMLTEGTDVPDVQSVFLTRQTTSRVLLTQMVGRALRGPDFGGTEKAYVVSFLDDWRQLINWAEFSLDVGATDDRPAESRARLPVHLVSIELLRQLATQMYQPADKRPKSFLQMLPVGWYHVDFDAQVDPDGDIARVDRLVLVYDSDHAGFAALLEVLSRADLSAFIEPAISFDEARPTLEHWVSKCFPDPAGHLGGDLLAEVFEIARHMAQSSGESPRFFPFDERSKHDLDVLAREVFDRNVGRREIPGIVQGEFDRKDRFWRALYGGIDTFRDQFELLSRRIENDVLRGGQPPAPPQPFATTPESYTESEAPEAMKQQVKVRDGWRCLCCGSDDKKYLQVDHVVSIRHGGRHELENLQTLCKRCNSAKGVNDQNFRRHETNLLASHPDFVVRLEPTAGSRDRDDWERCVRATLNHYYRCAAVSTVEIGARGDRFYNWVVRLNTGNDPRLLEPHLRGFLPGTRARRSGAGPESPDVIVVEGVDPAGRARTVRVSVKGTTST